MWKKIIKFAKKAAQSILYVLRCFFLANLCNLSHILYRKFPICFALLFLANLWNNLSYILYRKFPICFALRFLANLSNIICLI